MKTETIFQVAILGIVGYFGYELLKKGSQAADYTSSQIADLWLSWTLPPPITLLGNIVLPDGTLIPLSTVSVRLAPNGNTYAQVGAAYYQLAPSDANGNWPATPV